MEFFVSTTVSDFNRSPSNALDFATTVFISIFYISKIDQALNGPEGCSAADEIWWHGRGPRHSWHIDATNDGSTQCDDWKYATDEEKLTDLDADVEEQ